MATIKYNDMELVEITKPQVFNPPKRMVVWDNSANIKIGIVAAILPDVGFPVTTIDEDGIIQAFHSHCAEIPEAPKPRLATNLELARWLAQGNGQWTDLNDNTIRTSLSYREYDSCEDDDWNDDMFVSDGIRVRKWSDIWHEPTVDYLFGE